MKKLIVYQTDDMEAAVRSMSERHRNLLVTLDYKCVDKIRLQTTKKLHDVKMEMAFETKPESQPTIDRWRNQGGVLKYRSMASRYHMRLPIADAIMMAECPLQWEAFESGMVSARDEIVIYRPPSWSLHEKSIEHWYPRREYFEMMDAYLLSLRFQPMPDYLQSAANFWLIKPSVSAFFAQDLFDLFCWDDKFVKRLILFYKFRALWLLPVSFRLIPHERDLKWAWDILKSQHTLSNGDVVLRGGELPKRIPGFKAMFRRLILEKYVVRRKLVYLVDNDMKVSQHSRIEASTTIARGQWYRMREYMETLPEYFT